MNGPILRKYNAATTINFDLFEIDGIDLRVDAVHASGDAIIMKDEGAEANTGSGFVDEGRGYSLALTATEMSAARIVIYLVDQTSPKAWLDKSLCIETYGNASAQHAFDLDTASTPQTGDSYARLGAPAGASVSADLVTIDTVVDGIPTTAMRGTDSANTTTPPTVVAIRQEMDSNSVDLNTIIANQGTIDTKIDDMQGGTFNGTTDSLEAIRNRGDAAWVTGGGGSSPSLLQSTTIATLASQVSFTLTAGSADDDAYNNQLVVITDVSTGAQKAVGLISDYVGSSRTVTLSVDPGIFTMAATDLIDIIAVSTGPNALEVDANGYVTANLLTATQASVDAIEVDTTTDIPALIAALNDLSPANVLNEVNAALNAAMTELGQAVPAAEPSIRAALMLTHMMVRNRLDTNTSGTPDHLLVRNDAGTVIAKKVLTDDGSDYSEAKMVAGP